jgi:DMSO/TMAO reductase YedYZ molybdopterin-dependent catalytic subunit
MSRIPRGFLGRRQPVEDASRVPRGQQVTRDFAMLSAGPTLHTALHEWSFTISGREGEPVSWTCEEFLAHPLQTPTVDIDCVPKWTKLDTAWKGASVDTLLSGVKTEPPYLTAWSDGGYTSNLALEDVTDGLTVTPDDEPGFWETYGHHNHGDPWLEQRYQDD